MGPEDPSISQTLVVSVQVGSRDGIRLRLLLRARALPPVYSCPVVDDCMKIYYLIGEDSERALPFHFLHVK